MKLGPLELTWGRKPAAPPPPKQVASFSVPANLGGQRARLTQDDPQSLYGPALAGMLSLVTAPDGENRWRDLSLDSQTFDRLPPAELLELLCDLSPDVSRALWDFLRLTNPGWEAQALRPGSAETDPKAQAALDAFLASLGGLYGSVDVIFNRLFFSAWLRGGFFAELILDERGRLPVDLATPDPRWLSFRRVADPVRGLVWEPVQWLGGQVVPLTAPTIRYVPVDPFPGKPYGRPLASPALFTAIFALALLHDLRRVIQQQGYPRLDISIDMERLATQMPTDIRDNPREIERWLTDVMNQIAAAYQQLDPDDTYIHADWVTVNRPVGTVDAGSLGAVDGLVKALERMLARALKSTPLMMGMAEGTSEANANRQHELHIQGVKAIQHYCEQFLEYLLGIALRVQGFQAAVKFRFAENRAAELLRDAQVAKLNQENAAFAYAQGWTSQDEAAKAGVGKDKADQSKPRSGQGVKPASPSPDPAAVQADPGSNRNGRNGHARFNPHHDPHSGEFASGGAGGASIGEGPEKTPSKSAKAELAKQTSRRVGADVQRYSEEHCEAALARGLKGEGAHAVSLRDNEPVDVLVTRGGKITDGVELKVMTQNVNNKITMKGEAMARKTAWMKENSADSHVVVFNDAKIFNAHGEGKHGDEADREIYYRRGMGSFRVGGMHRCKDMAELRSLIAMPAADLPAAARHPANYTGFKSVPQWAFSSR